MTILTQEASVNLVSSPDAYGELGIRHEDTIFIGEAGAENMIKFTGSPEEPAVV